MVSENFTSSINQSHMNAPLKLARMCHYLLKVKMLNVPACTHAQMHACMHVRTHTHRLRMR